jgi:hypothetical protein
VTTGYEVRMYADISTIAQALNRIANCLETDERRKRMHEITTPEEIERAGEAIAAVKLGFADLEQGVKPDD